MYAGRRATMAKPVFRLLGRGPIGCLALILWGITGLLALWFFVELQYAAMFVPRCNQFTAHHDDLGCRNLYWRVHRALRNVEVSAWVAGISTVGYVAVVLLQKWQSRSKGAATQRES